MQKVSLNKGIKNYNEFLLLLLSSGGILTKKLNFFLAGGWLFPEKNKSYV